MRLDSVPDILAARGGPATLPDAHGGQAGADPALAALRRHRADRTRLLDMLWAVQRGCGHIPDEAVEVLARGLNLSPHDVRETASFYHFFHARPTGRHRLYLCDSVTARMSGHAEVTQALERETGEVFGQPRAGSEFSLFHTACIGLSDQEPALLVDDVVFTRLKPGKVADLVAQLRAGRSPAEIANPAALPADEVAYVDALVESNVRTRGPVFFRGLTDHGATLRRALAQHPEQILDTVDASNLRGRGGAGFRTGLKWRLCRDAVGATKYLICNADEGEPGTFKDRVLLTRSPRDVFVGMVIAAWAIGCRSGICYLRAEYVYLLPYLERQLQNLRDEGLLGRAIGGREGFDFDIRIQLGAGAYICGDESALIESCEGKRGTPRVKPPFPVHQGLLGQPTCVNNVETFACITRIVEEGAAWFRALGTADSSGTRLLSVSGDCAKPGIYEVEWGVTLGEVLKMVGARDAMAVQVSGPSGECVSVRDESQRRIAYEDLSCNGAFTVFDHRRDLLGIVRDFMAFFVDESCGICVPCRVGNVELQRKVERVIAGRACARDLDEMVEWGALMRKTSRCGLGTTSPKPILTTLQKFRPIYDARLVKASGPLLPSFDLDAALAAHEQALTTLPGARS
jgi:[NiFe] hydrogenase diaphorase moiety large subunit